jgi:hypothetical protein
MLQHPLHREVILGMQRHHLTPITQKVNVRPMGFPHFNSTLYGGENIVLGGHFGHFRNMYVKYVFAKSVLFNFGFHFGVWA